MAFRIGVIEGDGVGPEVVSWGVSTLEAAARLGNIELEFVKAPVGGTAFLETGKVLPQESLQTLRGCHAILKGPMGRPDITPGLIERDGILALRQYFEQYVNLRPVKLFRGLEAASPLKDELLSRGVDFVIVRENSEGLYSRMGGLTEHMVAPVHGSAPDIAGKGIVNPLATILSCALLLRHCMNREDLADKVERAVQKALDEGFRTVDIAAGETSCSTAEMGEAVLKHLS
jgi:isocitrate/isopropylmalate dehydrogenase